jgi:CRP-like cAMP-binding protein
MARNAQPIVSLGACPLFAGLGGEEVGRFERACRRVAYARGEAIVRQGQPAHGAFVIESGSVEVVTALPGGGETVVAQLGPGSVLGEMALLDRGVRSASVLARAPVSGFFIEHAAFQLLLAQREPAAFTVRDRIMRMLCQRLRALNARITNEEAQRGPRHVQASLQAAVRKGRIRQPEQFDWRSFLQALPAFQGFGRDDIDAFLTRVRCIRLARGELLFAQGEAGTAAYIVVRGALEIAHTIGERSQRIGILGPGRLCGILAMIEGGVRSMSARAREQCTLLRIPRAKFENLLRGIDPVSTKFQDAINRELLQSLARTNNTLTRLISQARIRNARGARAAQALQREIATLDVRGPEQV